MDFQAIFTLIKDLGVTQFIMLVFFMWAVWKMGLFKKNGHEPLNQDKMVEALHEKLETNSFTHISQDIQNTIKEGFRDMREDFREFRKEFKEEEATHHRVVEEKLSELANKK